MRPNNSTSMVAKKVLDIFRQQDEIIGHLTDYHIKHLLMFTYRWFGVSDATMTFDFHSEPKKIYISPALLNSGKLSINKEEVASWEQHTDRLKSKGLDRDLPGWLGLSSFEVEFCSAVPVGATKIDPTDREPIDAPLGKVIDESVTPRK